MLKYQTDNPYPRLFEGKTHAYDFDMVLSSCVPFLYFYEFIEQKKPDYKIYIELYILIRLYHNGFADLLEGR